jgi:hypothetical protein
MTTPAPNRYAGSCYFCGAKVPADAGTWSPDHRAQHLPGRCKTTTKTYRDTIAAAQMGAYREEVARMWAAAGYSRDIPQYHYHSVVITGHGLRALLGGERQFDGGTRLEPIGLEVYRDGTLAGKHDKPRAETGDYYGDWITRTAATIAILNSYREDS